MAAMKVLPKPSDEAFLLAAKNNLIPIQLICRDPEAGPNTSGGIACTAFVAYVPRIGETIRIPGDTPQDDDQSYQVHRVVHKLSKPGEAGGKDFIGAYVNVFATLI